MLRDQCTSSTHFFLIIIVPQFVKRGIFKILIKSRGNFYLANLQSKVLSLRLYKYFFDNKFHFLIYFITSQKAYSLKLEEKA